MKDLTTTQAKPEARRRRLTSWDGQACEASFEQAATTRPWTLGYRSAMSERLATESVPTTGTIPPELRGTFFRNGPALHGRGGLRYGHRWDGDGMVQSFRFEGGRISHLGAFVRTEKWEREAREGRLLMSGFGTRLPGTQAIPDRLDEINPANISVLRVADELLALWEAGSAYVLDPLTLRTVGIKAWSDALIGAPFSAHPRREPDGTIWNFGADPLSGRLFLYHISASGQLLRDHVIAVNELPPVHDFAVTAGHLVFVLPSMSLSEDRLHAGLSFAESCMWRPDLGMKVLVIDKNDFSIRTYGLPPGCLFHIGNAWEDAGGVIRLDMMRSDTPIPLLCGWSIMRGEYRHAGGARLTLLEISPDGRVEQSEQAGIEGEFPTVAPGVVGRRYRQVLCVARSARRGQEMVGYDEVALFDVQTHDVERYWYGDEWLVEEHLLVPDCSNPCGEARWIIGTALDLAQKQTVVSVFDASRLREGPIAQARLPYALPLGLHGRFELDR